MSGLYNIVFGTNDAAGLLLGALGFQSPADVGRFRDAWAETGPDGEPLIAVYTRNGGGNREHWRVETEAGNECDCPGCIIEHRLPQHPLYVRDADDEFDSTYATVYFRFPPELVESLDEMDPEWRMTVGDHVDTDDRWRRAIEALKGSGEAP